VAASPNVNDSRGALVSQTYWTGRRHRVSRHGRDQSAPHAERCSGVHFTYMLRPGGGSAGYFNRCGYNFFDASTGTFAFPENYRGSERWYLVIGGFPVSQNRVDQEVKVS